MNDAVYDTLVKLTKGKFDVPVKQRSAQQKVSCVRFWRNKSKVTIQKVNGEVKLFFDGKAVRKSPSCEMLSERNLNIARVLEQEN